MMMMIRCTSHEVKRRTGLLRLRPCLPPRLHHETIPPHAPSLTHHYDAPSEQLTRQRNFDNGILLRCVHVLAFFIECRDRWHATEIPRLPTRYRAIFREMSIALTRSPLESLGMNGGGAPKRRSARLSQEGNGENEPPAKKSKANGGTTSTVGTKQQDGESRAVASRKKAGELATWEPVGMSSG